MSTNLPFYLLARRHDAHPNSPPLHKPPDSVAPPPDLPAPAEILPKRRAFFGARITRRVALHASACGAAIMVSLMVYSLLQERIMTRPYQRPAAPPQFFTHSLFLVLANRTVAVAIAAVLVAARGSRSDLIPVAPLSEYFAVSLSNVVATSCQYEALKWLTFPTVTIGKCAKMLPVMLILKFRSGRLYTYDDFAVVGTVLLGCAVMISSGNVAAKHGGSATQDSPFGFVLMIVYLLFDAITSTQQESLFSKYDMSLYNQMIYINLSSVFLALVALTMSASLFECVHFILRFPSVIADITVLSLSAVSGQFAITYTIQSYGALLYAAIMTTRQFFSVLASDIIFKHGLTATQWAGSLMVFAALFFKLWRKATQTVE